VTLFVESRKGKKGGEIFSCRPIEGSGQTRFVYKVGMYGALISAPRCLYLTLFPLPSFKFFGFGELSVCNEIPHAIEERARLGRTSDPYLGWAYVNFV